MRRRVGGRAGARRRHARQRHGAALERRGGGAAGEVADLRGARDARHAQQRVRHHAPRGVGAAGDGAQPLDHDDAARLRAAQPRGLHTVVQPARRQRRGRRERVGQLAVLHDGHVALAVHLQRQRLGGGLAQLGGAHDGRRDLVDRVHVVVVHHDAPRARLGRLARPRAAARVVVPPVRAGDRDGHLLQAAPERRARARQVGAYGGEHRARGVVVAAALAAARRARAVRAAHALGPPRLLVAAVAAAAHARAVVADVVALVLRRAEAAGAQHARGVRLAVAAVEGQLAVAEDAPANLGRAAQRRQVGGQALGVPRAVGARQLGQLALERAAAVQRGRREQRRHLRLQQPRRGRRRRRRRRRRHSAARGWEEEERARRWREWPSGLLLPVRGAPRGPAGPLSACATAPMTGSASECNRAAWAAPSVGTQD